MRNNGAGRSGSSGGHSSGGHGGGEGGDVSVRPFVAPSPPHAASAVSVAAHVAALDAQTDADERVLDQLFATNNCTDAYLDVGSNIGVQVRKLYEPHKYRGAAMLPVFDEHFGPGPSPERCRVCAIGVEPNPRHSRRLRSVQVHAA